MVKNDCRLHWFFTLSENNLFSFPGVHNSDIPPSGCFPSPFSPHLPHSLCFSFGSCYFFFLSFKKLKTGGKNGHSALFLFTPYVYCKNKFKNKKTKKHSDESHCDSDNKADATRISIGGKELKKKKKKMAP